MKRCVSALLALLSILAFSGCETLLERDYYAIEKHEEPYVEENASSAVVAKDYNGLKSALLYFIGAAMEYGVIRVYAYDGDVSNDLVDACLEVRQDTPLGAWAVDYTSHEKVNFVSYSEYHIYITYRRTAEQILGLVSTNTDGLRESIRRSLAAYDERAAFRLAYFTGGEAFVDSLIGALSADMVYPVSPVFSVKLYPDSGVQRIVEVETSFPGGRDLFMERAEETKKAVSELASAAEGEGAEKYRRLFADLLSRAAFDSASWDSMLAGEYSPDYESGAYGALVSGSASSRGFAEAYLSLCRAAGLDCRIVKGTRSGEDWYWNMATLDGASYHVDAASAAFAGGAGFFLVSDAEMETVCQWNRTQYEAAETTYSEPAATPEEPEAAEVASAD